MPAPKFRSHAFSALLSAAFLALAATAFGSGFGIFTQGASALGQADAVVAHGSSPSAIFFNPALISDLPGNQFMAGTTLIFPDREFDGDEGGSEDSEDDFFFPSYLYLTGHLGEEFAAGFGIFNPFGLGTDWKDSWEARYIATLSEIETFDFRPVLSWRVHPKVTVAAGVDYLTFDADIERMFNPALLGFPALPDPKQKFSGDGDGWGYNLGLLIDFSERISFGAFYRSEVKIDIDGKLSFERLSAPLGAFLPAADGKSVLHLPAQLFSGLAFRLSDKLTGEVGLHWEDWSSFDSLKIDQNRPVLGQTTIDEPRKWHDSYAVNLRFEYLHDEKVRLLAGYLFGENPVPDSTFDPSIPDSDTHLLCIGTTFDFDRFTLWASYALQIQKNRNKNNQVGAATGTAPEDLAIGRYSSHLHLVGIDLTCRF